MQQSSPGGKGKGYQQVGTWPLAAGQEETSLELALSWLEEVFLKPVGTRMSLKV